MVLAAPLRRRDLGVLLSCGAVLLGAGCARGPAAVATADDVPRDPLAHLDEVRWDGRTAADVLALPIRGDAAELDSWEPLGDDDAVLDPTRTALIDFLETAYLSPEALAGLDPAAALELVSAAAPSYWREQLAEAWDDGERHVHGFALAPGFATIGRPALGMDWYRTELEGAPVLLLGGTIAWSVVDVDSHAVGVVAYRTGIVAHLDTGEDLGAATSATLRVTVHGLDTCGVREADGLVVPALADTAEHHAAQQETTDSVIASPRLTQEDLLDPGSPLLSGDDATNVLCA